MTEEEADALGARLAACPKFRPLPGLRDMQGRTWEASLLWRWSPEVDRPDMREPATLGIVLALVREAWGCAVITSPDYDYDDEEVRQGETVIGWRAVETVSWVTVGEGDTEAHALVAALEAAPA